MVSHDVKNRRLNKHLRKILKLIYENRGFVCGGFPRHLASPYKSKHSPDLDIYCKTKEDFENLLKVLKEKISEEVRCLEYNGVQTYTWIHYPNFLKEIRIQLINIQGSPQEITSEFDFTVCQAYYDIEENKIVTEDNWLEDETQKRIVVNDKARAPAPYRITKYLEKGYKVDTENFMKFLGIMNRTNLEDWELIGILEQAYKFTNYDKNLQSCIKMMGLSIDSNFLGYESALF